MMKKGFTLLELATVLLIIGLVTAMAMNSGVAVIRTARQSATEQKIRVIQAALQSYREANNRLPCPADLTIAQGATNFGVEFATPGTCTSANTTANRTAAGAANTSSSAVEGTVPVVALGLPNDLMYDGWGNRFRYVVDLGVTAVNAFSNIPSGCQNRAIVIEDATDSLITPRTSGAVYAILSHGENGHGGYTKNGVITNTGDTNLDELVNCHCDSSAAATAYAPTYVQKSPSLNPAVLTDSFNDIVAFKERWQMMSAFEKPQGCGYIYVMDYNNCRVQWFDTQGIYQGQHLSAGGCGSGVGQWNQAEVISIDKSGNIYISDDGNTRVIKFGSDWTFKYYLGATTPDPAQPEELTFDASGNVWAANWGANTIEKFNQNTGTMLATYGSNPTLYGDDSIAINPVTNNVWVCNMYGYNYQEWSTTTGTQVGSNYSTYSNIGDKCYSMAFDSKGYIWITDQNGKIYKLSNTDHITTVATAGASGPGTLNFAGAANVRVIVDSSDNVWVTDWANNRIVKFDSNGNYLLAVGSAGVGYGQFNGPSSLAFTSR